MDLLSSIRAHPRSRGEHAIQAQVSNRLSGSSPLARGTRQRTGPSIPRKGLIPARAGNTTRCPVAARRTWAHPRSRGEHGGRGLTVTDLAGSSPLARGTLIDITQLLKSRGLIPARAGNTSPGLPCANPSRAHPRSRGEHNLRECAYECFLGSSPLARGTQTLPLRKIAGWGLIPARAGNTQTKCSTIQQRRAHPRSRGEHLRNFTAQPLDSGSSPLARGTRR